MSAPKSTLTSFMEEISYNRSDFKYVSFNYFPDLSLAELYFKSSEEPIFPDRFKRIMIQFTEYCEQKKPRNLLISMEDKVILLNEELQDWLKNQIYPRLAKAGSIRKGYLISDDFHSQLSIADSAKNTIDSELKYFESKQEALEWFQKKEQHE